MDGQVRNSLQGTQGNILSVGCLCVVRQSIDARDEMPDLVDFVAGQELLRQFGQIEPLELRMIAERTLVEVETINVHVGFHKCHAHKCKTTPKGGVAALPTEATGGITPELI